MSAPWVRSKFSSRVVGRVLEMRVEKWYDPEWRYVVEATEFHGAGCSGLSRLAEGIVDNRERAELAAEAAALNWWMTLEERGWLK